ncbi:ABC transporter substrate-binding protein [Nostoc sp. XA010]|uniref:ABC transporter substrate-binding protein n=1 Tax=Nostoc sp. XA010 TaxID=2780407 RepID=UPI001E300E8C|nr:ABC transporter substrate-binding protein [Nostoc sp. XA010]MCC5661183.1 ABC transporter substrate-binding protein [Nostoc sp. XA010]
MSPDTPPDPIRSLVEQLQKILDWAVELFLSGNWSTLILLFTVAFISLAMPGTGLAYSSLSNILPEQYPIYFWSIVVFSVSLSFLFRLVNLNNAISRRWLVFPAWMVATIVLIFAVRIIFLYVENTRPYETGDKFSWGEEFLISDEFRDFNCQIDNDALVSYRKHDYKAAEESYKVFTEKCKSDPESLIYLNNSRALQTKNPIKIGLSVPISSKNVYTSKEILRGVALVQNEWNAENENRKLLVGITDDGYEGEDSNCGKTHDGGKCKTAAQAAIKLIEQEVLGVIGPLGSDVIEAASKIYENGKIVAISPTSTAVRTNINEKCSDDIICLNSYIFRTASNDSIAIKKLIKVIPPEIEKVSIVYESKSKYSRLYKKNFTEEFEREQAKDAIVNPQPDLENPCNFSRSRGFKAKDCLDFSKQKNANAFLLIPGTTNVENADSVNKILELNYRSQHRLKLLGADSMYNQPFITNNNKENAQGLLVAVPWQRDENSCEKTSKRLECKALEIFGNSKQISKKLPLQISWRTATTYDATQVLIKGLQQASEKKCTLKVLGFNIFDYGGADCLRKELKHILQNIEVEGVLEDEKVKFDEQGDRVYNGKIGVVVEFKKDRFILR